jgi:hypothetical protein
MPKATVVPPKNKKDVYVPECGDIIFDCAKYLVPICKSQKKLPEVLAKTPFVSPGWLHPNPWVALEEFEIDCKEFAKACEYEDCYTGNTSFAAVPVAILTDDTNKYRLSAKKEWYDGAFDHEWNRQMHPDWWKIGEIGKILMGTGYTSGTTIMDGSKSRIPLKAPLDNGDFLLVWCWEWYNK